MGAVGHMKAVNFGSCAQLVPRIRRFLLFHDTLRQLASFSILENKAGHYKSILTFCISHIRNSIKSFCIMLPTVSTPEGILSCTVKIWSPQSSPKNYALLKIVASLRYPKTFRIS